MSVNHSMRLSDDLRDKRWIVAKGWMFVACGLLSAALLILQSPSFLTASLIAICAWAFSRWAYFLYIVMPAYVDPTFRYEGLHQWCAKKLGMRR